MKKQTLELLETLGLETAFDTDKATSDIEISAEVLEAIEERDIESLEALLGARTNLVCGIFPAEDDDDQEEDDREVDDEEKEQASKYKKAV